MNVFVASTYTDLEVYRENARICVEGAGHRAELVERLEGVEPKDLAQLLRSLLRSCHICVLLIGTTRGSGPNCQNGQFSGDSYTMIEFKEAIEANLQLLPFFVGQQNISNTQEGLWLARFRDSISEYAHPTWVASPEELVEKLSNKISTIDERKCVSPSEREFRKIDHSELQQIFGRFDSFEQKSSELTSMSETVESDVASQRVKSRFQSYPIGVEADVVQKADELNDQGWDYHDNRQYEQALQSYKRALEICPKFPLVWNNIGLSYMRLGKLGQAKQCFFRAVQLRPGYVAPWTNLAALYWERYGDQEASQRWLNRAFTLSPDYPDAKLIDEAIKLYKEHEPIAQSDLELRNLRMCQRHARASMLYLAPARQLIDENNFLGALYYIELAVKNNPNVSMFLEFKAECLCNLMRFEEALQTINHALEIDPEWSVLWVKRAAAYFGMDSYDLCVSSAKKALSLGGELNYMEAALTNLTFSLKKLGKRELATDYIIEFSNNFPESNLPQKLLDDLITE